MRQQLWDKENRLGDLEPINDRVLRKTDCERRGANPSVPIWERNASN